MRPIEEQQPLIKLLRVELLRIILEDLLFWKYKEGRQKLEILP
jgi:hypothetical protein